MIKIKKLENQINQWSCINNFLQKILTRVFFPIGSCCQSMAVTSFFPIGCMKRQHAVILESIWETDLIITRFPAQRTGLLTPLLTCLTSYFTLLLPFTWTNYSKSNSLSPFFFLDKNFLSLIPLLSPFGRNYSKSNFNSIKIF